MERRISKRFDTASQEAELYLGAKGMRADSGVKRKDHFVRNCCNESWCIWLTRSRPKFFPGRPAARPAWRLPVWPPRLRHGLRLHSYDRETIRGDIRGP